MTVTQTITFESGDKARYFFNAGGQIILQPKFTGFDSKLGATVFTNLATSAGTWVISGLGGQIVGTIYTPFTKITYQLSLPDLISSVNSIIIDI